MTDIDRRGPPTREELQTFYKPKFTWEQLKLFINSGCVRAYQSAITYNGLLYFNSICRDLGLLKRDKELQKRYMNWSAGIKAEYGSIGWFSRYLGQYNLTFMIHLIS